MGYTLTEKVFARAAGKATANAGDELLVTPDYVLAYDFSMTTSMFFRSKLRKSPILKDLASSLIMASHQIPLQTKPCIKRHADGATRTRLTFTIAKESATRSPPKKATRRLEH